MKREYTTFWTIEKTDSHSVQKMPWTRQRFFRQSVARPDEIIIPDDITYDDLAVFIGRKTKVTIETVD